MQTKPLPIGIENFARLIEGGYYYVDKTLLIKELLDNLSGVTLFTRPRRFGKTLNMSMLKHFFEIGGPTPAELFEGLAIAQAGDKYVAEMGKYPVISLSLKDAKRPNFDDAYFMIADMISREYERHHYVLDGDALSLREREHYLQFMNSKAKHEVMPDSLRFLSECLARYHGTGAIILIDEYDVPLENAFVRGFYDEMIDFIRSLFSAALKTNDSLHFAVLTGCLRVSWESIFTGLNNLMIVSILNKRFGEHYGFTTQEVDALCAYYGFESRLEDIRSWYDGYCFGDTEVYNPWSVINFAYTIKADINDWARPYWANTSGNAVVRVLIEQADAVTKGEIETLIAGGVIEKPVHEEITYGDVYKSMDNLWNFLFFTGYLKKVGERQVGESIYLTMEIPNIEVRSIYKNNILDWFRDRVRQTDRSRLYTALVEQDTAVIEEEVNRLLAGSISYMDSAENFYHGFMVGILTGMENYVPKSNRESGDGRSDIYIRGIGANCPSMVLELKVATSKRKLDSKCDEALEQIETKGYAAELEQEGYDPIYKYGIAFFRKQCMVKGGQA